MPEIVDCQKGDWNLCHLQVGATKCLEVFTLRFVELVEVVQSLELLSVLNSGAVCVESACFLSDCMGFLCVLQVPPTSQWCADW